MFLYLNVSYSVFFQLIQLRNQHASESQVTQVNEVEKNTKK